VGLRQGDAVGLMTMSGQHLWLAPRKSQAMVNHILNPVYGLQPGLLTSDYYQAAVGLSKRLKKRALVVLISNLRDEDDDTLLPALRLLQKRHLVLFASLRERALDETSAASVDDLDQALTHAAAVEYRLRRDAAFRRLKQGDVVCLDVPPQRLAVALVNQYLDVKRSGRLTSIHAPPRSRQPRLQGELGRIQVPSLRLSFALAVVALLAACAGLSTSVNQNVRGPGQGAAA
jgi:uncharacterized protein (DUF58 family)